MRIMGPTPSTVTQVALATRTPYTIAQLHQLHGKAGTNRQKQRETPMISSSRPDSACLREGSHRGAHRGQQRGAQSY